MLADAELARRKPLWTALSALWLDTEVDRASVQRIASVAIASGYSLTELEQIYRFEVAPVVAANLLVPAGAWSGFDETWLHALAAQRARERDTWRGWWARSRFGRKLMTWATDEHWQQVVALVRQAPL